MSRNRNRYLLINSFGGGGAERQFSILADAIPFTTIFCLEKENVYLDESRHRVVFLSNHRANTSAAYKYLYTPIYALRMYKHLKHAEDIEVISVLERAHLVVWILSYFLKIRYGISIQLSHQQHYRGLKGQLLRFMFRYALKRSSLVIPNSKAGALEIIQQYGLSAGKVIPIQNGYDFDEIERRSGDTGDCAFPSLLQQPYILCVARFFEQKAQDKLIRAFAEVKTRFPSMKLVFAGTGSTMPACVALSQALSLKTCQVQIDPYHDEYDVYFLGFQKNPLLLMKHATMFAFPTYYEGLPNALIEAMICGAVSISSDCPTGPREIIAPNTPLSEVSRGVEFHDYGVLIQPFGMEPDDVTIQYWQNAMVTLLTTVELGETIKKNLPHRVSEYRMQHVQAQWEQALSVGFDND